MKTPTKTTLAALSLMAITTGAVLYYPSIQSAESTRLPVAPILDPAPLPDVGQHPVIEAVFVLDTTGSMGGLIQAAKDKIWSIAATMAAAQPAPEIRMGLVAYRDRGDDYVTRVVDLSKDLDAVHSELMQFQAQGGGDGPESVNQALHDALHRIGWSQDSNVYRVIFLVGDAPAHMDYQDDVPYPQTLAEAKGRGIRVNAIQCGTQGDTRREWQQVAQLGAGSYFQVEQGGSAVAIATPYDKKLATLSAELDATRIYYGKREERAERREKLEAERVAKAAASPAALASRAGFVTSESGEASLLGDKELVDEVVSGRVDLAELPAEELPAPLVDLDAEAQQAVITETAHKRETLKGEIQALTKQRADYVNAQVEAKGGAEDSLDYKIFSAVREQAANKGLHYDKAVPVY
ncbi:VWA domain-containing protein [Thiorhodococcus mannitoliphagus]|uniref:VWA domain-containing protein n=1 Tax=Thiorhodococcus mannitoliphagus TaxID=329406 RepID=A0A6P1DLU8_9GAMM|nr:vWA domain-containing protein [Thiorhodococcus mannitoliphagus]NEX19028.1 VWA domain-containing protein [Thiorhodococcus mannitoliphagus]